MRGQRIDQLYWDLGTNLAPLNAGIGQATGLLKKLSKAIKTPTGMFVTLGAVAAIAGYKGAKASHELEEALREVSTLLPLTVRQMAAYREEVEKLSAVVPRSAPELAKGLYQVVSAGFTDLASSMEVLRASAKAGVAGLSDTFTAVDAVTTVLNAYQMSAEESTRVTDAFFVAIREGKLTFPLVASGIGDVATSAAMAGVSIEELMAAWSTLSKFGVNASEATTSLNRFFLSLIDQTPEAIMLAKELGVEFDITTLRTEGLVGLMNKLADATGGNIEQLFKLNPEMRAFRAVAVLAGQGVEEFNRVAGETTEAAGATAVAYDKMADSAENLAAILKNRLNKVLATTFQWVPEWWEDMLRALVNATGGIPTEPFADRIMGLTGPEVRTQIQLMSKDLQDLQERLDKLRATPPGYATDVEVQQAHWDRVKQTQEAILLLQTKLQALTDRQRTLRETPPDFAGPQVPLPESYAAKIDELNESLKSVSATIQDQTFDVEEWAASYERFRQKLAETVDEAERLVMEQSSVAAFQENVEGLLQAWAAMPRELGTSTVMLQTVRKLMTLTGKSVDDMTDSERELYAILQAYVSGPGEEFPEQLDDTLRAVSSLSRSVIDLGRAFGFLGDNAAASLFSLGNVADQLLSIKSAGGWGELGGLGQVGAAVGIAAGVGSILTGIFGGGEDKAEQQRKAAEDLRQHNERIQMLQRNTQAIESLTKTYAEQLTGIRLGQAARATTAIDAAMAAWQAAQEEAWNWDLETPPPNVPPFMEFLEAELLKLGLSMDQVRELAKALGLEWEETAEGTKRLAEAFRAADLRRAFETFSGQLAMLRREFELFGTGPEDQLKALLAVLDKYTDLDVASLTSVDAVRQLFKDLPGLASKFGDMTADEIAELLLEIGRLMQEGAGEGTTTSYQVSRSITEVTGNRIAGLLTTSAYWNERTAVGVEEMLAIMQAQPVVPPTQGQMDAYMRTAQPVAPGTSAGAGPIVAYVTIGDIVVQGTSDPAATARAVAGNLAGELDRALGERMLQVRRARGLALPDGLRN